MTYAQLIHEREAEATASASTGKKKTFSQTARVSPSEAIATKIPPDQLIPSAIFGMPSDVVEAAQKD